MLILDYTIDKHKVTMPICDGCGVEYKKQHKCLAGVCELCQTKYRSSHKCPVATMLNFQPSSDLIEIFSCDGCGRPHAHKHKLHNWRGIDFCRECYNVPELVEQRRAITQTLLEDIVHRREICCELCGIDVVDPNTLEVLNRFNRDHRDVFTKTASICDMIWAGIDIDVIRTEAAKCRVICVPCHSIVTKCEHVVGIMKLIRKTNAYSISDENKYIATSKVETLVQECLQPYLNI